MDAKESLVSRHGLPSTKIKNIPDRVGVYLMKDKGGRIIYIGKAIALKKRLLSYFSKQYTSVKQDTMLSKVNSVDYILTNTETEALILESSLIKKNKPKYNVSLKDDKNYPLVKITQMQDFPRIFIVRRRLNDGSAYFGPYTNAKLLRVALKGLRKIFTYRTCRRFLKRPCLNFDLGLCPAPCTDKVSKKEYRENIANIRLFLEGRNKQLLDEMSEQMSAYAKQHNFEKAQALRDKISALNSMTGDFTSYKMELNALKNTLGLKKSLKRIEAFDISSISQYNVVGSMVSFVGGRADKNNYRRFRIKGERLDDCSAIAEVIRRRYKRVISGGISPPDLIIIDGGKGQLNAADRELEALKLKIPIISIAKKEEEIFRPRGDCPLKLNMNPKALNLIRRIRDEAHRFAISYHRLLRKKKMIRR